MVLRKNLAFTLVAMVAMLLAIAFVGHHSVAFADIPFKAGAQASASTDYSSNTAVGGLVATMYKFGTVIAGLIFGVSVIMIVWAGFKYATSQGETKVTEQAKMQIITAGIGIGVALLAEVIIQVFAEIYNVSGTSTTK